MNRRIKMRKTAVILTTTFLCAMGLSTSLWADELTIYPKEGQNAEQQEKDKFECYNWAKDDSGFDPMAPPTATEAPPQQQAQKGGVGRGAVRGAALGAIIDDSSEGARTGAKGWRSNWRHAPGGSETLGGAGAAAMGAGTTTNLCGKT